MLGFAALGAPIVVTHALLCLVASTPRFHYSGQPKPEDLRPTHRDPRIAHEGGKSATHNNTGEHRLTALQRAILAAITVALAAIPGALLFAAMNAHRPAPQITPSPAAPVVVVNA